MNESAREWIGMSDLMAGLMLVFLFLAVLFMVRSEDQSTEIVERETLVRAKEDLEEELERANKERDDILEVLTGRVATAATYNRYKDELHRDLVEEFKPNLSAWNAAILPDNTVRFRGPEVLFGKGSKNITPKFKGILSDFFPRYVKVLTRSKYKDNINEIRIVGHTSSEWGRTSRFEDRYLKNMELSQDRAFSVLKYCIDLNIEEKEWLGRVLRANGLAFAKPVHVRGKERPTRSRRVEFKVLTRTEDVERLLEDWEVSKE